MQGKSIWKHGFILTCFLFSIPVMAQTPGSTGKEKTEPSITPMDKEAIRGHFRLTEFTMQPGEVDQAVVFKDPANEQTVLFDLMERLIEEAGELHLRDGDQAVDRHPDRPADDGALGQRRVDDPVLAVTLQQVGRDAKDPFVLADVLTEEHHAVIGAQGLVQGAIDR